MTDTAAPPAPAPAPVNPDAVAAGALLRAARQQQGLHIAALAASIKVTPAKLEALEAGRHHELPDATFTRALAQAVCRALKIDPAPVLAQLPGTPPDALGRVDGGLNTPFRERPGRAVPADWAPWRHPVLWLVALLLVAAAAFVLVPSAPTAPRELPAQAAPDGANQPVMPPGTVTTPVESAAPASAPPPASSAAPVSSLAPAGSAPAADTVAAAAPALAPGGTDEVMLKAVQDTWVQAVDGTGQTLMARVLPAGETVALTPALPVRLRIGNVRGTELLFRGQPVPLNTRDNIANLTLP